MCRVRVGPAGGERRRRRFAAVQWERPFDLSVPGLVRFAVVRTGGEWAPVDRDQSSHPLSDRWSSPGL